MKKKILSKYRMSQAKCLRLNLWYLILDYKIRKGRDNPERQLMNRFLSLNRGSAKEMKDYTLRLLRNKLRVISKQCQGPLRIWRRKLRHPGHQGIWSLPSRRLNSLKNNQTPKRNRNWAISRFSIRLRAWNKRWHERRNTINYNWIKTVNVRAWSCVKTRK